MKLQIQRLDTSLLLFHILIFFLWSPLPIKGLDSSHFCNLISERKHDALRLENFKVNAIGGYGGTCELHVIENGRKYSGTVDLKMDTLRQMALPMSPPTKQTSTDSRPANLPLLTRYNLEFTDGFSISVQQIDNGTHLVVSFRQYIGRIQSKEEESFTFSGVTRNLVAHSVVLGPDKWSGYLFFEDFQGKTENDQVLVGMITMCILFPCQTNGGPPGRHSGEKYINDLVNARFLKPFLDGYMPYSVPLKDGDSRVTLSKGKRGRISPKAMVALQLLHRPPLGFMCLTDYDGYKAYLFDAQQAVVRVFAYRNLSTDDEPSLPLNTVDFWRFFNCHEPGVAPERPQEDEHNIDDTTSQIENELPSTDDDGGESFSIIVKVMSIFCGTILVICLFVYCCCCRTKHNLEHNTIGRGAASRRFFYLPQSPGKRKARKGQIIPSLLGSLLSSVSSYQSSTGRNRGEGKKSGQVSPSSISSVANSSPSTASLEAKKKSKTPKKSKENKSAVSVKGESVPSKQSPIKTMGKDWAKKSHPLSKEKKKSFQVSVGSSLIQNSSTPSDGLSMCWEKKKTKEIKK